LTFLLFWLRGFATGNAWRFLWGHFYVAFYWVVFLFLFPRLNVSLGCVEAFAKTRGDFLAIFVALYF
jgi:hypothetical protein